MARKEKGKEGKSGKRGTQKPKSHLHFKCIALILEMTCDLSDSKRKDSVFPQVLENLWEETESAKCMHKVKQMNCPLLLCLVSWRLHKLQVVPILASDCSHRQSVQTPPCYGFKCRQMAWVQILIPSSA